MTDSELIVSHFPAMEVIDEKRVMLLQHVLQQLTAGIVIPDDIQPELRELNVIQLALIRESLARLLVMYPNDVLPGNMTVWDLIQPHVKDELGLPDGDTYRATQQTLSKPLQGKPSEVLRLLGFQNEATPQSKIMNKLITTPLSPTQNLAIPQVSGRGTLLQK